jgi:histone H3/H4
MAIQSTSGHGSLNENDFKLALETKGRVLVYASNSSVESAGRTVNKDKSPNVKTCKQASVKSVKAKINYHQKPGMCFNIPKAVFERAVRASAEYLRPKIHITADALLQFQLETEDYLVSILAKANKIAKIANRIRVKKTDLETVLTL